MFCHKLVRLRPRRPLRGKLFATICLLLPVVGAEGAVDGQGLIRELNASERAEISIRNPNGRVSVTASEEQKKIVINAESSGGSSGGGSAGATVGESDVKSSVSGNLITIDVGSRRERDRIDLSITVPSRARVRIETESGSVDVVGDIAIAQVKTNTGTIHADVPLDSLNFNFLWEASHPRFLSVVIAWLFLSVAVNRMLT